MQCLSNTVPARYVILTSRAWMMWQSLSYSVHSFSCYATQSSNPFWQVFLIDIKTHEKVPEFMEDVLTELGIRQLSVSHPRDTCFMWSLVHVAVTVQRPFNWNTCSSEPVLKRKENFKLETTIFSHHKKLYPSVLSSQDYCY